MLTNKWRNFFFNLQWWQSESGFSSEQIAVLKHSKIICQNTKKKSDKKKNQQMTSNQENLPVLFVCLLAFYFLLGNSEARFSGYPLQLQEPGRINV